MGEHDLPSPPPEAVLIRLARQARGLTVAQAAAEAGILKASRWGQIENGYLMKSGTAVPTSAGDMQLAHMAGTVGVTSSELDAAGRGGSAEILRRIERQAALPDSERSPRDDFEVRIARIRANPQARKRLVDLLTAGLLRQEEQAEEGDRGDGRERPRRDTG